MAGSPQHQYDDDLSETPVTRPDLHAIPGGGETSAPKTGHLKSADKPESSGGDGLADQEAAARHSHAVPDLAEQQEAASLGASVGSASDSTDTGGGFYRDEGGKKKAKGKGRVAGSGLSRGTWMKIGAGGGILGIIVSMASLGSFLNVFKLDHVMKNVDQKAFTRLSASLDTRNRYLLRSYIEVRSTEIDGDPKHDNLFFKAEKVDNNSPFSDWYRTMRKSNFEKQLFNDHGITFVSIGTSDSKLNIAKLTQNPGVDEALLAKYGLTGGDLDASHTKEFIKKINGIPPEDLDKIFTVDKFDSHKAARRGVKEIVNDNVPWWRVYKRRHLRKDIHNVTGIKSWRLFEKTRDKLKKKNIKNNLYSKIIDKAYSHSPSTASMLKCLFSDGSCGTSSDPESNDNKSTTASGKEIESADDSNDKTKATDTKGSAEIKDSDGNVDKNAVSLADSGSGTISEVEEGIKEGLETGTAADAAKKLDEKGSKRLQKASVSKKIMYALIAKLTGKSITDVLNDIPPYPDPSKVWVWSKRIAKIDGLFFAASKAGAPGGESQISKMVKNARRAQLVGVFATYAMAGDQIKSGQLVGDELNDFFKTTSNLGNSDGWSALSGQKPTTGSTENNPKCKPDYVPQPNDYAVFCDSQKPNNGGNAQKLSAAYSGSVGGLIHPFAEAVSSVEKSTVGKVADFASNLASDVIGKAVEPVVDSFLKNTGLGKTIQEFMGGVMEKLLGFLGAGPMFDPGQPNNIGNMIVAGGVAQAEDSTRASGGIKSTAVSAAYTDKLAANYTAELKKNESLKDRYLSLDSPDSVASTALFAVANTSVTNIATKFSTALGSIPQMFGSLVSGRAFAQEQQTNLNQWAGVDRYDIPHECINFDPLDDNPRHGTNYYQITGEPTLDWATLTDNDKFYKKVYEWADKDNGKIAKAETIWNCRILDTRAMGSIGVPFGYTNDAGYDPGGSSSSSSSAKPEGGIGAPVDGFIFPLKTTKDSVINHKPSAWCYQQTTNCHHQYNAADIFADTGTEVIAPTGGKVVSTHNASGGVGSFVVLQSDKGYIFYFAHMKEGSIPVAEGQTVNAGDKLGEVGTNADAEGTASHLHFDVLPSPPETFRPACSNAACLNFPFIDFQKNLVDSFNQLPG